MLSQKIVLRGYYCPKNSISGTGQRESGETARKCPAGYYCPIGTKGPEAAQTSQECGNLLLGETQNQACEHGDYDILHQANSSLLDDNSLDDSGEDDNFKARKCPAGYYCLEGTQADTAGKILVDSDDKNDETIDDDFKAYRCHKGYQCDEGTAIANWQYCADDTYQDELGANSAHVDSTDNILCKAIPVGSFFLE